MQNPDETIKRVYVLRQHLKTFLSQMDHVIMLYRKNPTEVSSENLAKLAVAIWELRHFTEELLKEKSIDESLRINAEIILNVVDQPVFKEMKKENATSLITAADQAQKDRRDENLKYFIREFIIKGEEKEILFDDLKTIATELTA